MTEASRVNADAMAIRPRTQPPRKLPLVAAARGVRSSRITGMIVNGDAAMARASGTISPTTSPMGT
jgi:hypothetical protein